MAKAVKNRNSRETPAVLVVEDDWLVASDIAEVVESAGCNVIGPAHSVSAAMKLLNENAIAAALLDVNIRDGTTYTIAETLRDRGIPFIFVSGYSVDQLRPDFRTAELIPKPFQAADLRSYLQRTLRRE